MTGRSVLAEMKGVPQAEVDLRPHMLGYSTNLSFDDEFQENGRREIVGTKLSRIWLDYVTRMLS